MKKSLSLLLTASFSVLLFSSCGQPAAASAVNNGSSTGSSSQSVAKAEVPPAERDQHFYLTQDPADFDHTRYDGAMYLGGNDIETTYLGNYNDGIKVFHDNGFTIGETEDVRYYDYEVPDFNRPFTTQKYGYSFFPISPIIESTKLESTRNNWDYLKISNPAFVEGDESTYIPLGEARFASANMNISQIFDRNYWLTPYPWSKEELDDLTIEHVYDAFGAPSQISGSIVDYINGEERPLEEQSMISYTYYYEQYALSFFMQKHEKEDGSIEYNVAFIDFVDTVIAPYDLNESAKAFVDGYFGR